MKRSFFATQFALIVLAPLFAVAVDTVPPETFTEQHSDVVAWIFGLLLSAVIFLIWRMICQNDRSFEQNKREHEAMLEAMKEESEKKWDAIGVLTRDLSAAMAELNRLKGEHDALKTVHYGRRVTDHENGI